MAETPLTRELYESNIVSYYRKAGGTRPDLCEVRAGGESIVVKDFRRSDPLFRFIVGPILIRREFGALRNLVGVEGVPRLVGKIDRYAVAMQHIAATRVDQIDPALLDNGFYDDLRGVIDAMHSRGVAHCDLRSRGNVMRGADGKPYIVDFAACVYRGRGINPFTRWLFGQFVLADRNAVLLLKGRLTPDLLTDAEESEVARPLPFERPAKFVGENVRRLTRRFLTRKP
jgi:serine/threonine protein kinase